MRKVFLAFAVGLVLVAASSVIPAAAFASVASVPSGPARPHAVARPTHLGSPGVARRAPSTASPAAVACDGQFHAVTSPNGTGENLLFSNTTVSANDGWAVGIQTTATNVDRTLAEHWNGTSWSVVPTVNTGSLRNDLFSVSAVSSTNVWAVGAYDTNSSTQTSATIAEHWNGTKWSKVTTVNPSTYSYLFAVTALSSTNVWAVGTYYNFTAANYQTLVEHYNGSTWAKVSSPNTGGFDDELFAISAWSATDIWGVGSMIPLSGASQSLALHSDGSSWQVVSTPNTTGDNEILGVTALEGGHAVGVGDGGFVTSSTPAQGFQWDLVVSPSTSTMGLLSPPVTGDVILEGVARSSGSVWVVGFFRSTFSAPDQSLVWHATWDSSAHTLTWASSPGISDDPGAIDNILYAVDALTPSVFWAVGTSFSGSSDQTLTEVYCALHFNLAAPATAVPGSAFSVTVTAKNADSSTATDYRGTVHFTSSDAHAVLPGDYTFTPGDAGAHTFGGVVLRSIVNQPSSITASDTVTPFVTGSANVTVACVGVCPSTAGTPGSRDVLPGPTAGPPGTRVPTRPRALTAPRLAALGGPAAATAHSATLVVPRQVGLNMLAAGTHRSAVKSTRTSTTTNFGLSREGELVLVSARVPAASQHTDLIPRVEIAISLGLLVFALLAFRRRRSGEELSVHNQT